LSRWAALNLCGNYRILNETETFRIRRKPIHATTPRRMTYLMNWLMGVIEFFSSQLENRLVLIAASNL
jgi:hypothetical protein